MIVPHVVIRLLQIAKLERELIHRVLRVELLADSLRHLLVQSILLPQCLVKALEKLRLRHALAEA